jgi:hypothetical protein
VYFPGLTPLKISSSDWSTYYEWERRLAQSVSGKKHGAITLLGKYIPIARMPTLSGDEKGMMLNAFLD